MMDKDIHMDFGWVNEYYVKHIQDMLSHAQSQARTGRAHYKSNGPHASEWKNPTWKMDQPWPTHGNWIHEALMAYVDKKAYELPPTIYMQESFDGTWYPQELSDPNYKHINYFKP